MEGDDQGGSLWRLPSAFKLSFVQGPSTMETNPFVYNRALLENAFKRYESGAGWVISNNTLPLPVYIGSVNQSIS